MSLSGFYKFAEKGSTAHEASNQLRGCHTKDLNTVGFVYKATLYKAHFFTENRPVGFS